MSSFHTWNWEHLWQWQWERGLTQRALGSGWVLRAWSWKLMETTRQLPKVGELVWQTPESEHRVSQEQHNPSAAAELFSAEMLQSLPWAGGVMSSGLSLCVLVLKLQFCVYLCFLFWYLLRGNSLFLKHTWPPHNWLDIPVGRPAVLCCGEQTGCKTLPRKASSQT